MLVKHRRPYVIESRSSVIVLTPVSVWDWGLSVRTGLLWFCSEKHRKNRLCVWVQHICVCSYEWKHTHIQPFIIETYFIMQRYNSTHSISLVFNEISWHLDLLCTLNQDLAFKNETGLTGNSLKITWLEGQPAPTPHIDSAQQVQPTIKQHKITGKLSVLYYSKKKIKSLLHCDINLYN